MLSKLTIKIKSAELDGLKVAGVVGLPDGEVIKNNDLKFVYVVLQRDGKTDFPVLKLSQMMTFTITEIDVDTEDEIGSYEEEYAVADVMLAIGDYMKPELIPSGQFGDFW